MLEPGKRVTIAMGTNRDITTGKWFIHLTQASDVALLIFLRLELFSIWITRYMFFNPYTLKYPS